MIKDFINRINTEMVSDLMVEIPGGKITLRDDRIDRVWTTDISPFLLAKHPVTQDLYHAVTGESPSTYKGLNRPVETVSWKDAVAFCNLLSDQLGLTPCYLFNPMNNDIIFNENANGYRLPSEAEWEYACKAGTTGPLYGELNAIGWYKENAGGATQPVALKQPNEWGLYDMIGNVWEWCTDIYDETVYGSYRIFRGGGWADVERSCLATNRRRSHPTSFKIDDLGFRIAKNRP